MEDQDLSVDSQSFVGGCGCLYCCSSGGNVLADERQLELWRYEASLAANFAAAVVESTESDGGDTQRDGVLSQPLAATPVAVAQADDAIPLAAAQPEVPVALAAAAVQGASAIAFSDVTRSVGLELPTQTWGSAIGDYDGDGFMDIWLNRHQLTPILYRNLGDGTFEDVTDTVFLEDEISGDFHGSAFIDINNDGTQDLLQLSGGDQGAEDDNPNKQKKLFINTNGELRDQAVPFGVDYLLGRGRVPVIWDPNGDGLSDFVFTGTLREDGQAPATLFVQRPDGTFENQGPGALDTDVPSGTFGVVSDLDGDGNVALIYASNTPRLQVYEASSSGRDVTLQDVTADVLPTLSNSFVQDVVVGDFNGDAKQDLFIVRQSSFSSGVREDSPRAGRARLLVPRALERGISLETAGNLNLNFQGDPDISVPQFMSAVGITPDEIKIGAAGVSPDSLIFNVNQATASGRPTYTPGVSNGVFIWYEDGLWNIVLSNNNFDEVNFLYKSNEIVTQVNAFEDAFPINPVRGRSSLLINQGETQSETLFQDEIVGSGLEEGISGANVVSGDFDNDGDLDLYVVATDLTSNQPNILYENQGDGTFVKLNDAGGASGQPTGGGAIPGIGDGVSTTDFDNDGDLDLFVTNGDVAGFRRPFLIDGTSKLYQNDQTTGNHWILIDLVGIESTRDAIGARVTVTTTDGKTQIREQNGGIHNRSQNDKRIHFGLGQNSDIESLEIRWPSGLVETLNNLEVDQILTIEEGTGVAVGTGGNPNPPPTPPPENQVIEGTSASESLLGAGGRDIIRGKAGNDTIEGFDGNDNLFGNAGADIIIGGAGNDLIVGDNGNDQLTGGAGQDKFLYNKLRNVDTITDFNPLDDVIRIRASKFGGGLIQGDLNPDQFHIGTGATQGSHRVIYNDATGDLLFDEDGNGAIAAVQFVSLQGLPSLSAEDIKIV